jgi:MFS family permease
MAGIEQARARYRDALRVGEFRALFLALCLSTTGVSVTAVALTVVVYQRTSSPFLSSLTFALGFLPYLVGGTVLSALVDRVPARRLLTGCSLGSAALVTAMAWPGTPVLALLALLVTSSTLTSISSGARTGLVRTVVPDTAYVPARSLLRIASQIAQVAGNAVGGALLVVVTPHQAMLVNTAAFAGSAALTHFGLRADNAAAPPARPPLLRDSLSGLRDIFAVRELRRLLLLGWLVPTFAVAPEALAAPYVGGSGGSTALVGVWLTALPVGMIAGNLLGVCFVPLVMQRRSVAVVAATTFIPFLAFALHPPVAVALMLLVGSGACSAYSLGLDQLVRDAVPRSLFARAMTVNTAGLMTLQGLGFAIAGGIAQVAGPSTAVALAGGCGLVTVALLRPAARRSATQGGDGTSAARIMG